MKEKGSIDIELVDLVPIRDMRVIKGKLDNLLAKEVIELGNVNDYISKDWLGELDNLTKNLSEDELAALGNNSEYIRLSTEIQQNIQNEIMVIIKNKLNSRGDIIENVKKQMYIINEVKEQTNNEQRKSMAELNDYLKNYSHLTFNQYKEIKNGVTADVTNKSKNKKKE